MFFPVPTKKARLTGLFLITIGIFGRCPLFFYRSRHSFLGGGFKAPRLFIMDQAFACHMVDGGTEFLAQLDRGFAFGLGELPYQAAEDA
jgi:hypothetical protein